MSERPFPDDPFWADIPPEEKEDLDKLFAKIPPDLFRSASEGFPNKELIELALKEPTKRIFETLCDKGALTYRELTEEGIEPKDWFEYGHKMIIGKLIERKDEKVCVTGKGVMLFGGLKHMGYCNRETSMLTDYGMEIVRVIGKYEETKPQGLSPNDLHKITGIEKGTLEEELKKLESSGYLIHRDGKYTVKDDRLKLGVWMNDAFGRLDDIC